MKLLLLVLFAGLCMLLAGCAYQGHSSSCPMNHQWTPAEQKQMLVEVEKLPNDSILLAVLLDYARMRKELE